MYLKRNAFRDHAVKVCRARFELLVCEADVDVLRERIRARSGDPSEATEAVVLCAQECVCKCVMPLLMCSFARHAAGRTAGQQPNAHRRGAAQQNQHHQMFDAG